MRRFTAVKIREALRLREMHVSNVQISRSLQCGRSTLIEIFRRCDELGVDYSQACQMSNTDLEQLLRPPMEDKGPRPNDPELSAPVAHKNAFRKWLRLRNISNKNEINALRYKKSFNFQSYCI